MLARPTNMCQEVNKVIEAKYNAWLKYFGGDWDKIRKQAASGKMPKEIQKLALYGLAEYETAQKRFKAMSEGRFGWRQLKNALIFTPASSSG